MVKALVAVANGSEEIETLTPVDLLRRAGAEVTLAATGDDTTCTLSRGVKVVADDLLSNVLEAEYDIIIVPGGLPGASNLAADPALIARLQRQKSEQKYIAAICAAPALVLQPNGLLDGEVGTCYPAFAERLADSSRLEDRVVVSNKIITSRGPGTAMEFAIEIIRALFGDEQAQTIKTQVLDNHQGLMNQSSSNSCIVVYKIADFSRKNIVLPLTLHSSIAYVPVA